MPKSSKAKDCSLDGWCGNSLLMSFALRKFCSETREEWKIKPLFSYSLILLFYGNFK